MVGREFVQEDDRRSRACLLEIETDTIVGDGIGHLIFLFLGRPRNSQLMLAAAMRRNRFLFRHEMIAESPRNRSCTAAPRLALAIPQLAYERRMSAITSRRGLGVSKRNEYGPVVCVAPVACHAGVVFGGSRRVTHPGFG